MKIINLIISYLIGVCVFCISMYVDTIRLFFGIILTLFMDNTFFAIYTVPAILSTLTILLISLILNRKIDIKYSVCVWIALITSFLLIYSSDYDKGLLSKIDQLYKSMDGEPIMLPCLLFALPQEVALLVYFAICRVKQKDVDL